MTGAIEAKSLSSLTTLASNPPRYPRNPTHEKHDPVVLYIARVPGSRDVFLSPMKPRQKVVTAEDVQSCLYYLHLDRPEDDDLKKEATSEYGGSSSSPLEERPINEQPPIARKPLPVTPASSAPLPTPSNSVRRKPLGPPPALSVTTQMGNLPNLPNLPPRQIPHALTPGRPHHQRGRSNDPSVRRQENIAPGDENRRWSAAPYPESPNFDISRPLPHRPRDQSAANSNLSESTYPSGRPSLSQFDPAPSSPATSQSSTDEGTSLTLIRRDPASGAQWNVGKIRDPPSFNLSSENFDRSTQEQRTIRKPGAPLYIEINNPGYTKFLHSDMAAPMSPRRSEDTVRSSRSSFNPPQGASYAPVDTAFRRRIWFEGSRYVADYFGHKKSMSNDSGRNLGVPGQITPTSPHSPILPDDSGFHEARRRLDIPAQEKKSGYRGPVFESPWRGRCEFITGGAGDSLRCRHILPVSNNVQVPEPVSVSELRFNLPSLPSAQTDDRVSKRSSALVRPALRGHSSSMSVADHMRADPSEILQGLSSLNLSLGKEYAGGGFGGKQAKLGKLIIRDEGLKMMDLLVAANMSLWWRAYERVEAATR
ncbi:uncharacterized protein J3D65DRAFT_61377 [Phyllosticta citribraziliensis]|uniref:Uncharacterized protein n=1 Tax=Phyllosticta citribraziliensis TaxID=989973 RepID=A0ABR1LCH3_9PEZI